VGSLSFAEDASGLKELGIVRVLTMGSRLNPSLSWPSNFSEDLTAKSFDIEDHPCADLLGVLRRSIKEINRILKRRAENGGPGILVHCASGISRSVSVCIAWLMLSKELSLAEAHAAVKKARPQAMPNHGFLQSLALLESENRDIESAHKLWLKANEVSKDCRDRVVLKMRERADKASDKAARLERRLQRLKTEKASEEEISEAVRSLRKLARDVEKLCPKTTIDDNIAHHVRRATAEKLRHLLSIWEPLLPPSVVEEEDECYVYNDDDDESIEACYSSPYLSPMMSASLSAEADELRELRAPGGLTESQDAISSSATSSTQSVVVSL